MSHRESWLTAQVLSSVSVKITGDGDEALILSSKTNENYTIKVELTGSGEAVATVTAVSAFGAKHGLESLAQMVNCHITSRTRHDGARAVYYIYLSDMSSVVLILKIPDECDITLIRPILTFVSLILTYRLVHPAAQSSE